MLTVTVPATTANLGPGFDCVGAALTLYNSFTFHLTDAETRIEIEGGEAGRVTKTKNNLVYQAFRDFFNHLGLPVPAVHVRITLGVPLSRGLGSSATAIIGGLVGANLLAGAPYTLEELLPLAIAREGHPDNVVPALLGGCRLAVCDEKSSTWVYPKLSWHEAVVPIIAIPNFELSTEAARQVLPQTCSYGDAIFNLSHLGLLIRGLELGQADWLTIALGDRLHQPYRTSLIQGYDAVAAAAKDAGAYGLVISGAGPTLLALGSKEQAPAIMAAMELAWQKMGVVAQVQTTAIADTGVLISDERVLK